MLVTARLMAVLAHPDDESLGVGRHAREIRVRRRRRLSADRHARRQRPLPRPSSGRSASIPGPLALATSARRNCALPRRCWGFARSRCSTTTTSISTVRTRATRSRASSRHLRRVRPDVVVTFGPDGAYGHPDHIAISQFTTAAIVAAADAAFAGDGDEAPCRRMRCRSSITSPGRHRRGPPTRRRSRSCSPQSTAWSGRPRRGPTGRSPRVIDTRDVWPTVWRAIVLPRVAGRGLRAVEDLSPEHHEALWGWQTFYRAFSTVNGGRAREDGSLRRDCR